MALTQKSQRPRDGSHEHLHIHHHFPELLPVLERLTQEARRIMATAQEILAKVTANTDVLKSVAIAADALNEGMNSIAEEIAELKRIIAEGGTPDFTEIEAAVDEQSTVAAGLKDAVGANTPAEAKANR